MNIKKLNIIICFVLILSCALFMQFYSCYRYKYIDLQAKETKNEKEKGIKYTDTTKEKKQAPTATSEALSDSKIEYGKASYYSDKFQGKPTASGELYDRTKLTAAHRTLPFGTYCRVTNTTNKKSVTVRINDRGPHVKRRIIDLSYEAMRLLDGLATGEINVMVKVLK